MLPEQPAHDDMDEDDNGSREHFMFWDSWGFGILGDHKANGDTELPPGN
jgi:hypothetical protein